MDIEKPLVSVCIQTYQHVEFIQKTIEGVLMQKTNFPIEILIGEDESSDGTREICIEYAKKYPDKIRLFLNERKNVIYIHGKPTGRWNLINNFKHANGKYIAMLPGDDYWTSPLKLQKQVDILEKNLSYSMCFHDVDIFEEDETTKLFPDIEEKNVFKLTDLFSPWFIPTSSMVFRNCINLPEWYTDVVSGDFALHFLIAEQGDIYYLRENLAVYRKHPGGISRSHLQFVKAVEMSRLYHYLDLHFDKKYRSLVDKAIESEIKIHIEYTKLTIAEQYNRKLWRVVKHPVIRPIISLLRMIKRDKSFGKLDD